MRGRRAIGFVVLLAAALAVMAFFACGGKIAQLDEGPPLAAGTSTAPPEPAPDAAEDGGITPDATDATDASMEQDAEIDDVVYVPLPPLDANILPRCVGFVRDADNGAPSTEYPAFHPTMPEIVQASGPTMATPTLVAVTFDVDRFAPTYGDFMRRLPSTAWWQAIAGEYGIATPAVVVASVPEKPLYAYDDSQVAEVIYKYASGPNPLLPPTEDPNNLYVVFMPLGISVDPYRCNAYHWHYDYPPSGKPPITVAVIPNCSSYAGLRGVDAVTARASRVIVGAVTDPLLVDDPGWGAVDFDHYLWQMDWGTKFNNLPVVEASDLCTKAISGHNPYLDQPPDLAPYWVERIWSNSASRAQHFPCGPPTDAYFAATALLKDKVYGTINPGDILHGVRYFHTRGMVVLPGTCRVLEIDLQSDRDLGEPMQIEAYEPMSLYPACGSNGVPGISVAAHWDRKSGVNGEKLHLTVDVQKNKGTGYSAIMLSATAGGRTTWWPVVLGYSPDK